MRRVLLLVAIACVATAAGCAASSGQGTGRLVGLPASEAICRVAKDGLSYRIGAGPVVKPSPEIACRRVDGPQPTVVHAARSKRLVVMWATCPPTVGCL